MINDLAGNLAAFNMGCANTDLSFVVKQQNFFEFNF